MMVKCQDCGFENQMGSIFCRKCGVKLNLDAMDPKLLKQNAKKETLIKNTKKRIKQLVINIVVLGIVVTILGLLFYNGGLRTYEEPAVSAGILNTRIKTMQSGERATTCSFSPNELTILIKENIMPLLVPGNVSMDAMEVTIDGETVTAYAWIKLFDKVPVLYTIVGKLNFKKLEEFHPHFAGEEPPPYKPLSFDIDKLVIGRLPFFFRADLFTGPVESIIDNDFVSDLFQYADSMSVSSEGIQVKIHKKPAAEE